MKNYLKILVVFMLVFAFAFSFVSCKQGDNTDTPDNGEEQDPPIIPDVPPDPPVEPSVDMENSYRIRFVYSYSVFVTNSNDRKEYVDEKVSLASIFIPMDNPVITDEIKAEIENLSYHGYNFESWHYDWNFDKQTPVEGSEVDFGNFATIDKDFEIYGERGNIAGDAAAWNVQFTSSTGEEVPAQDIIDNKSDLDVKDGVLTISGEGAMFNFDNADEVDIPWYKFKSYITKIVVEEGITTVGANAFGNLDKVKEVILPESLVSICDYAFSGCSNTAWRYLELPSNVKTVGANAFNKTKFKEVVLNDGLESIASNAFYGSNAIRTIVIPTSLKSVGIGAFHPGTTSGSSSPQKHDLSKVYYKGESLEAFNAIQIDMDNAWLNEHPTIYVYTTDDSVGNTGAYWHYAENDKGEATTVPVQYCYTISYKLPGAKLPFGKQSVPVSVMLDDNGNIVTDSDGIPMLEGIITQEILDDRIALSYHNMKFVGFNAEGSAPKELNLNDKITADYTYVCLRGNILSDNGGIIWEYDGNGTLRISKNNNAPANASYKMWDFAVASDTGTLWTRDNDSSAGSASDLNEIKRLIIGDGIEHIGSLAFAGLTSVSEVLIPASVKSIAPNAFTGCSSLLSIYYDGAKDALNAVQCKTVSQLLDTALESIPLVNADGSCALLETNPGVYSKVEVATADLGNYWMRMTDNSGNAKYICWSLTEDGHLTVGGDNEMINFEHPSLAPWYGAKADIKTVTFKSNITSLGEHVISGYTGVTEINLPHSLRVVPASALEGTGVVNNRSAYVNGMLVIEGVLVKIDPSKLNKQLVETYVGINIIAGGAFEGAADLERIYIASTVRYINAGAFDGCDKLKTVYYDGPVNSFKDADGEYVGPAVDAGLSPDVNVYYKSTTGTAGDGYWIKDGNEYIVE